MLDHLVYAAPNLDEAIGAIERQLGVRPAYGGRHAGGLTHNALLSLGEGSYLEIIAPVDDTSVNVDLPFGLAAITKPRVVAWAMSVEDLDALVESAKKRGYDPGPVGDGARELPDGSSLKWRLAFKRPPAADGLVPFFIQWKSEPHPSATSPSGCTFVSLRAEHPEPASVQAVLDALAVKMPVDQGAAPRLIATLDTPNGRIEFS
jgi:hypothetical protein